MSRMVRESTCEDTAKAMRVGKLALIRPVMTSTDGRCVATMRWMPVARASCARRQIWRSTSYGAAIIRSASSSMMTTQYGRAVRRLWALVVALDVAHADRREPPVAAVHLVDDRLQRADDLVHVGDDLREREVRDLCEVGQLDALRVDHHEAQLLGRVVHQEAGDDRVDADALAAAGRAGDQQVRHLREVGGDRLAGDALAERERQLRPARSPSGRRCSR